MPLSADELLAAGDDAEARCASWTSRLWDFHLPREGLVLKCARPDHFERVLRERVVNRLDAAAERRTTESRAR